MFMHVYDSNLFILSLIVAKGIGNMILAVEHIFVLSFHPFELIQWHVIEFVDCFMLEST